MAKGTGHGGVTRRYEMTVDTGTKTYKNVVLHMFDGCVLRQVGCRLRLQSPHGSHTFDADKWTCDRDGAIARLRHKSFKEVV